MKKHHWNKNRRYRNWVNQREIALHRLWRRAQLESADVVRSMLTHSIMTAKAQFTGMSAGHHDSVEWFEAGLKQNFEKASLELCHITQKLRARSYLLARASESEIIGQISPLDRHHVATVHRQRLHEIAHKSAFAGGNLMHRIRSYVDKLRRKITTMAQTSALTAKDPDQFARTVAMVFPKPRRVRRPKRVLKGNLMEAASDRKQDAAVDAIDDQAWDDMLASYKSEYLPTTRGPEFIIGQPEVTGSDTWYAWEFERDMTNEFVQSVRDGQIDAAKENGITDFVWIAVIDDRTDACCAWRDGLLVSEIQEQLADHEDEDDACNVDGSEGLTPPLHFNCRCTLAPATDQIPEKPDDGAKDFDEWLNS